MVKFEITQPDKVSFLQKKTVCDVITSQVITPLFGKITLWTGSVSNEYFIISFIVGALNISLSERDCELKNNVIHYANSEGFSIVSKGKINLMDSIKLYIDTTQQKEQNEISFTDVMVALDWKYNDNPKIYYDNLMNEMA